MTANKSDYPMPLYSAFGNLNLWELMEQCGMENDPQMPPKLPFEGALLSVEARNGISYLQPQYRTLLRIRLTIDTESENSLTNLEIVPSTPLKRGTIPAKSGNMLRQIISHNRPLHHLHHQFHHLHLLPPSHPLRSLLPEQSIPPPSSPP